MRVAKSAAFAVAFAAATVASAAAVSAEPTAAPRPGAMTSAEISASLKERGFEVQALRPVPGGWEAEITNSQGRRVTLRVDPRTAALKPREQSDLLSNIID